MRISSTLLKEHLRHSTQKTFISVPHLSSASSPETRSLIQASEMMPALTLHLRRLRCHKTPAIAILVIIVLYIVVDVDLLPRLFLRPAKFSDWYGPKLAVHRAQGSNDPIHPHPFFRLLQPPSCPQSTKIAIYVHSAPANRQRRALIRATWGHRDVLGKLHGALVFVLGESGDDDVMATVKRESERHADILLENFRDSYANLTFKAVAALTWVAASCSRARFVLKTDDDVLADVDGLVAELASRYGQQPEVRNLLLCSLISSPPVNRQWWSKWYVSKALYAPHNFGSFCEGAAFVLSADVAAAMAAEARDMPFFPLDDVFVTGMLAEKLGVQHLDLQERFHTGNWGHLRPSAPCLLFAVQEEPLHLLTAWLAMELRAAKGGCPATGKSGGPPTSEPLKAGK